MRVPLIVFCAVVTAVAISGYAQTAPTAAPPAGGPTSSKPQAKVTLPEAQPWRDVGATAQCRDGTFLHEKIDQHSCVGHGGIAKYLEGRGQDLIR